MAKYAITHSCGHEVTHQLYGKHSGFGGRDEKIDWLGTVPCTECSRKEKEEQYAAQNLEATQANAAIGAPPLLGSEKQTTWAETIRRQTLVSFSTALERIKKFPEPNLLVEASIKATIVWLLEQTDATWWIETIGTRKSEAGLAPLFTMLDGKTRPASEAEILRHVMLESPHLSEEVAEALHLGEQFRARVATRAAVSAKTEMKKELEDSKPVRPPVLQALAEKHGSNYHWNKKIYSGRRIFVAGSEIRLSKEEEQQITEYQKAASVWLEKWKGLQPA